MADIRLEPPGATSEHIAYGHVNGRLPWAYARPRAAFSVRVRMEPKSSGILRILSYLMSFRHRGVGRFGISCNEIALSTEMALAKQG